MSDHIDVERQLYQNQLLKLEFFFENIFIHNKKYNEHLKKLGRVLSFKVYAIQLGKLNFLETL